MLGELSPAGGAASASWSAAGRRRGSACASTRWQPPRPAGERAPTRHTRRTSSAVHTERGSARCVGSALGVALERTEFLMSLIVPAMASMCVFTWATQGHRVRSAPREGARCGQCALCVAVVHGVWAVHCVCGAVVSTGFIISASRVESGLSSQNLERVALNAAQSNWRSCSCILIVRSVFCLMSSFASAALERPAWPRLICQGKVRKVTVTRVRAEARPHGRGSPCPAAPPGRAGPTWRSC